ncbi:hypothetical protein DL767_010567 [Monosporascus sp. MG133]|nr:hypothetical protein DL767_010567 [Monosporascus sp. MG133]
MFSRLRLGRPSKLPLHDPPSPWSPPRRHRHPPTRPLRHNATDNEYDSSNLDLFKDTPNFGRDSSQQFFQPASRAAFETPTSPSVRSPGSVLLVVNPVMPSSCGRGRHRWRGRRLQPGSIQGLAASGFDQSMDKGLPTPRHPSKRLQVLGASEVSSLPSSGNLGGRTHVSDSGLDDKDEEDSQGACQNYRNTPPSDEPEHTLLAADRSIVVRAGESSPPLPCPKMSPCPLYRAALPRFVA